MHAGKCAYTASKHRPEEWHGSDPDEWGLDAAASNGGLGIEEWECPHPPMENTEGDERYCIFHTDPENVPEERDEAAALRDALKIASRQQGAGAEHRGQFIGATFGAVTFTGKAIGADDTDIRFDHASFRSRGDDIRFDGTTFATEGTATLSFAHTTFSAEGGGDVRFEDATISARGDGSVRFERAEFVTRADGDVRFENATVVSEAGGDVRFVGVGFRAETEGSVDFENTTFQTRDAGQLRFSGVTFSAAGNGDVNFWKAEFVTDGRGDIEFAEATFAATGSGEVHFEFASFTTNDSGNVRFVLATFRVKQGETLWFPSTEFVTNADGRIDFEGATFLAEDGGTVQFEKSDFITGGDGGVLFKRATFAAGADGTLEFFDATFRSTANGFVRFTDTTFSVDDFGLVKFTSAEFGTEDWGWVEFGDATFEAADSDVVFRNAAFTADGDGSLAFHGAEFTTTGRGDVVFKEASFVTTEMAGYVIFTESEIVAGGDVQFDEASFRVETDPERGTDVPTLEQLTVEEVASVDGGVVFSHATLTADGGDVSFDEAALDGGAGGKLQFRHACFDAGDEGTVRFADASVHLGVDFRDAEFASTVEFTDAYVEASTELGFGSATFEEVCRLGAREGTPYVRGEFDFSDVAFEAGLEFRGGRRSGPTTAGTDADVPDRTFEVAIVDGFRCAEATFPSGSDFSGMRFPSDAVFREASLVDADLSGTDLTGTDGTSTAVFDGADLSGANLSRADLSGVSFERARLSRVELFDTTLVGARLYGALLGDARIDRGTTFWPATDASIGDLIGGGEATLGGGPWHRLATYARRGRFPYCIYDPRYATVPEALRRDAAATPDLEKAAEMYSTVETVARDNSFPGLSTECFLGRKDVQFLRYRRDGRPLMAIRSFVPNLVARYGESPWRVLGTGAAIISGCGLGYWGFDLIERSGATETPVTLLDSIYFSALTFTTLGYGDFNPVGPFGQFLAVVETSLGVILLAILVFVFGRRATR